MCRFFTPVLENKSKGSRRKNMRKQQVKAKGYHQDKKQEMVRLSFNSLNFFVAYICKSLLDEHLWMYNPDTKVFK